jgi:hypothetical protein
MSEILPGGEQKGGLAARKFWGKAVTRSFTGLWHSAYTTSQIPELIDFVNLIGES